MTQTAAIALGCPQSDRRAVQASGYQPAASSPSDSQQAPATAIPASGQTSQNPPASQPASLMHERVHGSAHTQAPLLDAPPVRTQVQIDAEWELLLEYNEIETTRDSIRHAGKLLTQAPKYRDAKQDKLFVSAYARDAGDEAAVEVLRGLAEMLLAELMAVGERTNELQDCYRKANIDTTGSVATVGVSRAQAERELKAALRAAADLLDDGAEDTERFFRTCPSCGAHRSKCKPIRKQAYSGAAINVAPEKWQCTVCGSKFERFKRVYPYGKQELERDLQEIELRRQAIRAAFTRGEQALHAARAIFDAGDVERADEAIKLVQLKDASVDCMTYLRVDKALTQWEQSCRGKYMMRAVEYAQQQKARVATVGASGPVVPSVQPLPVEVRNIHAVRSVREMMLRRGNK